MTTARDHFTREDYRRLPEGYPAQLIDGALVKDAAPAPWHQWITARIYNAFCDHVGRSRVLFSPVDLTIDDRNVFQPDVVVFAQSAERGPEQAEIEVPIVVVEVLSESTAAYDRGVKARRYLEKGVREVWLVDPDTRTVEVRTSVRATRFESGSSAESTVILGFTLELAALFVH